jgi:hypothetical protein
VSSHCGKECPPTAVKECPPTAGRCVPCSLSDRMGKKSGENCLLILKGIFFVVFCAPVLLS